MKQGVRGKIAGTVTLHECLAMQPCVAKVITDPQISSVVGGVLDCGADLILTYMLAGSTICVEVLDVIVCSTEGATMYVMAPKTRPNSSAIPIASESVSLA